MNKKRIILIALAGCMVIGLIVYGVKTSKTDESKTTDTDTVSGVVYNPDGGAEILDGEEETTDSTNGSNKKSESTTSSSKSSSSSNGTASSTGSSKKSESTTSSNKGSSSSQSSSSTTGSSSNSGQSNTSTGGSSTAASEYEAYHAMSGAEQKAYLESFESIEAFFEWYNAAKAEYEAAHPSIEIENGSVDLSQITGN